METLTHNLKYRVFVRRSSAKIFTMVSTLLSEMPDKADWQKSFPDCEVKINQYTPYQQIFISPFFDTSITELHELTEGKTLEQLEAELQFQLKNGETPGGEICGQIVYAIECLKNQINP